MAHNKGNWRRSKSSYLVLCVIVALAIPLVVMVTGPGVLASDQLRGSSWPGRASIHATTGTFHESFSDTAGFPHVLVVTPVKDALKHLPRYFRLLRNMTLEFPASRLSLSVLDGDSSDTPSNADAASLALIEPGLDPKSLSGTLVRLIVEAHALVDEGWHHISVGREDLGFHLTREARHGQDVQRARRAALSRSRNHALMSGLRLEHDWVLWLDADLAEYGSTALMQLLEAASCGEDAGISPPPSILVPNVVMARGGRTYDLNSWRGRDAPGSDASVPHVQAYHDKIDVESCRKTLASHAGKDGIASDVVGACSSGGNGALRLEGYGRTGALYLDKLRSERKGEGRRTRKATECGLVRLDGVGGGMLLVKADLHRHGLMFPVAPYRHRIETEGLAMAALDFGHLSWGLPDLEVVHK